MNTHNIETEIKLYTPDLNEITVRLDKLGATRSHQRVFEQNVRYDNSDQTLSKEGFVLRLREDSRIRLTWKGRGEQTGNAVTREEIEVEVNDFANMEIILNRLGYTSYMRYEKYRTTYHYQDCEIVLDELPYGNFTEIEGEAEAIEAVVTALNLSNAIRFRESYSGIFETVKRNLNLQITDLTFDAFEDIQVHPDELQRR